MTPIINFIGKHFAGISRHWCAEGTTISDAPNMLRLLADSQTATYLIDEAEFDTTAARDDYPAHFEDGRTVTMPAPIVWIEYKAYAPPHMQMVGRSAFLGIAMPEGVRVVIFNLAGPIFMASHGFDLPAYMLDRPGQVTGRTFTLGCFMPPDPLQAQGANFFMELLSFIALGERLKATTVDPLAATARAFRAEIGAVPGPYTSLRFERTPEGVDA